MAKKDIKVSEIQKEYDKTFKEIKSLLKTIGEDVTNAQSTLYPPTVKKLRGMLGEPPKKPATKEESQKSTSAQKGTPNGTSNGAASTSKSTPTGAQNAAAKAAQKPPTPGAGKGGAASNAAQKPSTGIKPGAQSGLKPGTPTPGAKLGNTPGATPDAKLGVNPNMPTFTATPGDIPKPRLVNKNSANIPKPSALGQRKLNNTWGAGAGSNTRRPGPGQGRTGGRLNGGRTGGPGRPSDNKLILPGQLPPGTRGPKTGQGGANGNTGRGQGGNAGGFPPGKPGPNGRFGPNTNPRQRFTRRGEKAGAFGGVKTASQGGRKGPKNPEVDIEMPTIHGFKVPKGDGKTTVRLKQGATLTDFAEKIGAGSTDLAGILFKEFGQMVTATQSVDEETLELLAVELGYIIETVSEDDLDRELLEEFDIDLNAEESDNSNLEVRPPVVTVMGHVDHGKTRLLDAVRNTNVIEGEAGGITQRIGAYQIHLDHQGVDRKITFIDTPGHEAFTAMRARGAEITDVAILVVAADDGVMPQTVEAINHAQSAGVPIVVAVNKIDKEGANPDKVRGQLTEFNLVPEEYGGDTMFVNISAKQGDGITELLDAVLLTVDAALEITANPNMLSRGAVIEARLDKGRGPIMSVLVQTGTIRIGDPIVAGRSHGRVRAMYNEHGRKLKEAYPSCPVRILGMQSVPTAGDTFLVADDERTARQIAEARESAHRAALLAKRSKRMTLEALKDAVEEGKVDRLNLIIKGDTSGSVEALEDALLKLEEQAELNNEVGLNVIHRGVGSITQNDVNLATVDDAVIIAFNVKPAGMAGDLADAEGVDIRYYDVIYQVIEDIELSLHGMLKPEYEEEMIGFAEVREIFKSSRAGTIAGCLVKGGVIKRNAIAKVMRDEKIFKEDLKIDNLKRFKDDAASVKEGFECGISFNDFDDLELGDVIEAYEMVEKKREIPKIASRA